VLVDSTRCNQALLNLCVNAQDAMPDGGKLTIAGRLVRLNAAQAEKNHGSVGQEFARCSVTDTGTGIPPEIRDRIFDPFFTTKEKGKGTGLGLPIVRRVVEEAGGFIELETAPGCGTTFHLHFPVAQEAPAAQPAPAQRGINHGAGRVLVVEDMDLLRDFTCSFLQTAGMTVLVAADAREAIAILESEKSPPDLLFTDFAMPGMNGLELIEYAAVRWPKMRRVLASGCLDEAVANRLAELEVCVIAKPYEMRAAADTIIRYLPKNNN
jgi:CheY-like chemotaxis protein